MMLRVLYYILPQVCARFALLVRSRQQILHAFHRKCAATDKPVLTFEVSYMFFCHTGAFSCTTVALLLAI